jgi:hypothetical protein
MYISVLLSGLRGLVRRAGTRPGRAANDGTREWALLV